jgi:GGDEF domain-containing protein
VEIKMSRKNLLMGIVFLLGGSVYFHFDPSITLRRSREVSFVHLIQALKTGELDEVDQVFYDGDYKIHLVGEHLPPVSTMGRFSHPQTFLSIQVYKDEKKLGYFCAFPTSEGYRAVSSGRTEGGEYLSWGNFATQLVRTARELFGIERELGWEHVQQFDPRSFDQLPSYLGYYYYAEISSQHPASSKLERFIHTVDEIRKHIEVSPEKIAEILSHPSYGYGNFSEFGLYYRIVKQYPGEESAFFPELLERKKEMVREGFSQEKIINCLITHIRSQIKYNPSDEALLGLLYAAGILSWRDALFTTEDRISSTSPTLISFSDAEKPIISDITTGKFGWLGVLDVDQLRQFNGIFSKDIMNFILTDIRRTFNYFLAQADGLAFAYRQGDEIGIYFPEGDEGKIQEIVANIREYLAGIEYRVFYLQGASLTPAELGEIEDILQKYNAYISDKKYGGFQLGIIRGGEEKVGNMLGEVEHRLGRSLSYDFYLEGIIKEGFVPSFSGGIVSIEKIVKEGVESPEDIFQQACYRAQDTQIYAKQQGRDNIVIGYREEYRHEHTGQSLISEEFRTQLNSSDENTTLTPQESSGLTPRIYNEQEFREIVYDYLENPDNKGGLLLWVCPRYNGNEGLHEMNEKYTLQGGDDIIRTIAYFLEQELNASEIKGTIIGRRIDRFFIFIPGLKPEKVDYEKILTIFSGVQHYFKEEIPGVEIAFDVYGAFSSDATVVNPGRIFQEVMYAEREDRALYFDLWGNSLGIFGAQSEEEAARIEKGLTEEAVENLVTEILTQRILPGACTLDEIKTAVENDFVLNHIGWDYIYQVLEKYNLLPRRESFIPCLLNVPC